MVRTKVGIIYHDLKPENILLDSDGHIKVVDFGLALATDAQQYGMTRMGTSMYMAPELANQRVMVGVEVMHACGILAGQCWRGLVWSVADMPCAAP